MNKKYIFTILAGASMMLIGCTDDFGQQTSVNNQTGDEIVFGGRTGYEVSKNGSKKSNTRTIYAGKGNTYTENGKIYESVNWVKNDSVRIYCAEAAGTTAADYTVNVENTGVVVAKGAHSTGLTKKGAVALQWGEGKIVDDITGVHDFYAVYPAPTKTYSSSVFNGNSKVTGEIPQIQTPVGRTDDGNGNYTFAPNMQYAYMVAKSSVSKHDTKQVYLHFMPIATAVEITLTNLAKEGTYTETIELTNILVSSKSGAPIFGQFTADLSAIEDEYNAETKQTKWKTSVDADDNATIVENSEFEKDGYGDTYPSVSAGSTTGSQITIPMYSAGLYGDRTPLAYEKSVTFTVFMLPTQDINDLVITVQGQGSVTGTLTGVTITKHLKTYLTNLPIIGEDLLPFTQAEWIKYVEDDAIVRELSIPGAGGATSGYEVASGTQIDTKYRQQNLEIPALWDKGIRCFEFTVDISQTDMTNEPVICNGQKTSKTLGEAVGLLKTQIQKYPDEFAMVIITYQNTEGFIEGLASENRDPQTFMNRLATFWSTLGDNWEAIGKKSHENSLGPALYDPANDNVGESRGKLFCIARPTSAYEDDGPDQGFAEWGQRLTTAVTYTGSLAVTNTNPNILIINGWGSLKDKWQARGYAPCIFQRGNNPNHASKDAPGYDANEIGRPFDVQATDEFSDATKAYYYANLNEDDANFHYGIQSGTSSTITPQGAWVQEWARVVKNETSFTNTAKNKLYWAPTYEEKVLRIKECLNHAIGKTKGDIVYINSLCGYYVNSKDEQSFTPNSNTDWSGYWQEGFLGIGKGWYLRSLVSHSEMSGMSGDIANYAADINKEFYDYLQTKTDGTGYIPGSMGIILMDRVGEVIYETDGSTIKSDAGDKIPSIIVANNFQHKMDTGTPDPAAYQIPTAEYNGEPVAAPKRRGASDESEEMSITWE